MVDELELDGGPRGKVGDETFAKLFEWLGGFPWWVYDPPCADPGSRSLIGISQNELSEMADVGISTIKRIELAPEVSGSARTLLKLQSALEQAGIEFIPAGEGKGPGIRLSQEEAIAPGRRRR